MRRKILISLIVITISANFALADCPSADLTGDCFVDFEDFALMAAQWLNGYYWNDVNTLASQWLVELAPDPCGMVWVDINDPGIGGGHEGFTGKMSKYETTNAQYCEFLNAALASGDIYVNSNSVYGADGNNSGEDFVGEFYFKTSLADSDSQIRYSGGTFSVRWRDGYYMGNHPVVFVSWYGATAFCNYYGYRLPTEWEWQAVADYDGSYIYGCGTTIMRSKANYKDGDIYSNPLGLSSFPYTSPVDYYPSYGYGMNDMSGNVWEWMSNCYFAGCEYGDHYRTLRGGCWSDFSDLTLVSYRFTYYYPDGTASRHDGFRVCR